jgi:hypothetical protein
MMWLALACGIVGGSILSWYACRDGWFRRRPKQAAPQRHHLQRITTQIATPKDLLDSLPEAGAPLPIEPTPTTGVANPKRRT